MTDLSAQAGPDQSAQTARRQHVIALLAAAAPERLSQAYEAFGASIEHDVVRPPETGLVMVRGRMGGTGAPFNLGEVTVTRCVVRLASGIAGYSYVLGRDKRKALHAAVFDALWQSPEHEARVESDVIAPLQAAEASDDATVRAETAATRVDFFTMVRGED